MISAENRATLHRILDLVIDRNNNGDATGFDIGSSCLSVNIVKHLGEWGKEARFERFYSYADEKERISDNTLKGLEMNLLTEARAYEPDRSEMPAPSAVGVA